MIGEQGVMPGRIAATGYAGFWKRFAALMIDLIILGIAGGVLTGLFGERLGGSLNALAGWLYFAGMESSERQATVGKAALGIYVTGLYGDRISFARATLRYFAKIISAVILMVGFLMAAISERRQALHDMLADTLVLNR